MPHSINVKKSISSADEALFQYVNRASEKQKDVCWVVNMSEHRVSINRRGALHLLTCFSAHAGNTWEDFWSPSAPVYHIEAECWKQAGSDGDKQVVKAQIAKVCKWMEVIEDKWQHPGFGSVTCTESHQDFEEKKTWFHSGHPDLSLYMYILWKVLLVYLPGIHFKGLMYAKTLL